MITELINKRQKIWRQIVHLQNGQYRSNGYYYNRNTRKQYDVKPILKVLIEKSEALTARIQDEYSKIKLGNIGAIERFFNQKHKAK